MRQLLAENLSYNLLLLYIKNTRRYFCEKAIIGNKLENA